MKPADCGCGLYIVLLALLGAAVSGQDSRPASAPAGAARKAGTFAKLLELDHKAEAATRALIRLGKHALPPLAVALDDPRVKVKVRAMRVLAAMGSGLGPGLGRGLGSGLGPEAKSVLFRLRELARDHDGRIAFPAFKALACIMGQGRTLIADYAANRIIELDREGKQTLALDGIVGAWDAERLPDGNLLVCEFSVNRVREITREGKEVWKFTDLKNPYDADRLPDGNTLIADTFGRRVVEVDKAGKVVWKYDDKVQPYDVERLPDGNTLIADGQQDRILEVDRAGKVVWKLEHMANVHDVDRLPNGNTLITIRMLNQVREVDRKGRKVWEIGDLKAPSDADRLLDGHTLVAENGMVREFDKDGRQVRAITVQWAVEANRD